MIRVDIEKLSLEEVDRRYPRFLAKELLADLYEAGMFKALVLGMREEEDPAGVIYGVIPIAKPELASLDGIVILESRFRNMRAITALVLSFLAHAAAMGAKVAAWRYRLPVGERNPAAVICAAVERYRPVELKNRYLVYRGESAYAAAGLARNRWYDLSRFKEKGFAAVPWFDYPQKWKDLIHEKENVKRRRYLGPVFDLPFEERTSFALVHERTGEPAGWMLCTEVSASEVEINRYYVYDEYRSLLIGPSFGSFVVERVKDIYPFFSFKVAEGNRSMERISEKYFARVMGERYDEAEYHFPLRSGEATTAT